MTLATPIIFNNGDGGGDWIGLKFSRRLIMATLLGDSRGKMWCS